jgi:5-methylcytosine-specific restriction protein A
MKITIDVIRDIYSAAKDTNRGITTQADAINKIVDAYKVKRSSVTSYLRNFFHMMNGEEYSRTMNHLATEFYLKNIYSDFGYDKLQNALTALRKHISYYESIRTVTRGGLRSLLEEYGKISDSETQYYPEEITHKIENYSEGSLQKVFVNRFERNKKARLECISHYKAICVVCAFDFAKSYSEIGRNFIHVHHLIELSTIAERYIVDPIKDLRPVCPNCHAMLHQRTPAYSIDELMGFMNR